MSESRADEIRSEMAQIRCDLHDNMQGMVTHAREMTDWRYYVRSYPWGSVAAAAAIGYLVVPKRLEVMQPDARTLAKLAKQHKLMITPEQRPQERGGIVGEAFSFLANLAVRGLLAYAGQQAGKFFGQQTAIAQQQKEAAEQSGLPPRPRPYPH